MTIPADSVVFYRDEKNRMILFEINGRVVARMPITEWSFAIANPVTVNAPAYDFSRGEPA
ncbi:hypothetical protein [Bradyrhizobium sp. Tv2a-2]|uniref:hypothetical protein n=1 Tax=Bradyrhizobium sp. Tv2a-2 TaxID=113395 RepID=UPI0004208225|nr:hypothetical protein [Bradyrhizobium sp. Tv2a-2]